VKSWEIIFSVLQGNLEFSEGGLVKSIIKQYAFVEID